jgi:SSS family solute:Na+ symporter
MNMHWIDWAVVVGLVVFLTWTAIYTKKYTLSVADFLAANRCARRYLLSVAQGMAGVGAISIVAGFEMYYKAGFTAAWWQLITVIVTTVIFLSGWVFYRFRQTRALTMAQFLEMRYSKKFRIFAGLVAYLSGIINFGIFPAVGARFFIHFCGLPDTIYVYAVAMLILLALALFFTFVGGQIAIMVTDFVQGAFTNVMFVVIMIVSLCIFSWPQISDALATSPANASMIHPFQAGETEGFNIWYFLILAFTMFYTTGVWQGSQGYNAAALNAHEARMGKILSSWRILPLNAFMMVVPVCVYALLNNADFAQKAALVRAAVSNIANPQMRTQMTTVVGMSQFLPIGIFGCMVGVMLSAFIANCDTYLHSWGSIFVQDVILPFKKKPFETKQHMFLLRLSIFGVALFIFIFSLVFRQTEYIYMFFMITGAIFIGGAGAVVFGGLYWNRGTTLAAWAAMITGSTLSVAAVIIRQIHASHPFTGKIMGYIASQNGAILSFYASAIAIFAYISISLLGKRTAFNMDKLLHRGQYAVDEHLQQGTGKTLTRLERVFGVTVEFNRRDKALYLATMIWTFLWIVIFVGGTVYNMFVQVSSQAWMSLWKYYTLTMVVVSIVTVLWFTIGGLLDIQYMFRLLRGLKRDDLDDGTVYKNNDGK